MSSCRLNWSLIGRRGWNSRRNGGNVVAKDCEIHFQQVFLVVPILDDWNRSLRFCKKRNMWYGSIPINTILMGWTSIYQLFWCSPGVQGFDTLPHVVKPMGIKSTIGQYASNRLRVWMIKYQPPNIMEFLTCQNKGVITPLMLGRLPLGTLKPYMKYCQKDVTFNRCLDSWWIVIYYIPPNIYFRIWIRGTRNGILDVDGYPLVICYIAIESMAQSK